MPTCTFFGHRDSPASLRDSIYQAVVRMIEDNCVDRFYVGHQGMFDHLALAVLQQVGAEYPHIRYEVVLAYVPTEARRLDLPESVCTMLPDGIETVPKRLAISRRNSWMVEHADYVIAYALYHGGALQFVELAKKKGKKVVFVK